MAVRVIAKAEVEDNQGKYEHTVLFFSVDETYFFGSTAPLYPEDINEQNILKIDITRKVVPYDHMFPDKDSLSFTKVEKNDLDTSKIS